MNRRQFFKGLLALPVVAALAPLLPKPGLHARILGVLGARIPDRSAFVLDLWNSAGFVSKVDISDLLLAQMKLEGTYRGIPFYTSADVPKDTVYLLDRDRMVEPARFLWIEDA